MCDIPVPELKGPGALVVTHASLVSTGTERAALEFAKASFLEKGRSRPDLVRQVLEKVARDGIVGGVHAALTRLGRPVAPGYACSGIVAAMHGVDFDCVVGVPVACAGAGYATHAEVNFIPRNLMVPIPRRQGGEHVSFEEACFATVGAIALHAVRLARPELSDRAVVIGLGLIGLVAVQILRAHGCRVLGVDPNPGRCRLATTLGADEAVAPPDAIGVCERWTGGIGADLVLIAAATGSSAPAVQAAELARDRARIVAVGAVGLDLPRREYYHKELSVIVSRSYGPGRYDPEYEEKGRDYPLAYVRWTERENMRAFLDLLADGRVNVEPLITHRVSVDSAVDAYRLLDDPATVATVITYPATMTSESLKTDRITRVRAGERTPAPARFAVSVIGSGNFATQVLLPALRATRAARRTVVTATGLSGHSTATKHGFDAAATDAGVVFADPATDAVLIATRHNLHAGLVIAALQADKAVFVEKPLCLTPEELEGIVAARRAAIAAGRRPFVMIGFNRRFAPLAAAAREHMKPHGGPVNSIYRINAGRLPKATWVSDPEEGGGRIIGEVCHFLDLCAWFAASRIASVFGVLSGRGKDDVMITARLDNGAIATVAYMIDGDKGFSKERIELFGNGRTAIIDDFRKAILTGAGPRRKLGGLLARQNKGHAAEITAFTTAAASGDVEPVPFADAVNVTRATFAVLNSIGTGQTVHVVE